MPVMNKLQFKKLDESTILDKIKGLLNITGNEKDVLLQFALDDTKATILNYCNLAYIPQGLETVWLKMAMEFYSASGSSTGSVNVGSGANGQVKSIKEGDVTIEYDTGSNSGSPGGQTSTTDGIINNYLMQLNQFRKVRR